MNTLTLSLTLATALAVPAHAAITIARDSTSFTGTLSQIEGDVDPADMLSSFRNHPSYPDPNLTLNGGGTMTVVVAGDTFSNWQMEPATNYLDRANGWTWETRFRIDSANVANRGVWEIFLRDNESGFSGTRIHFLAGGIDRDNAGFGVDAEYAIDLTDGFHTVRGAVEGGTNLTTVWVDGVKAIDALPSNESEAPELGVIGRWGGQTGGGTATIDYIRFDTTGAFAPIPEPASVALLLMGSAFGLRRRR